MTQWIPVAGAEEIPVGKRKIVKVNDVPVAVFHQPDGWYAIQNICPHRGGPLGEGHLNGNVVTCPWHAWQFDITSGRNALNPAAGVNSFEVKVEGNEVYVNAVPKNRGGPSQGRFPG
ncbi:MAG TPA: Rieske 2Fe-2S domain-containing protein [Candidatus Thermoplasmatota archaeon]|nr:Rieske 2Fe-2S domain-containing protein [Candidatus Thermoplasmatota archaeon]